MKKLFLFTLAAVSLLASGCSNDDEYGDVTLEETSVRVPYLQEYGIRIENGSGEYTAAIDRPEIADVKIEETYGAGIILQIQTKEGGEALITVTDVKSGKTAECSLFVSKDGISVTDIRYGVEADGPESILADLKELEPYPVGSRFVIAPFSLTAGTTGEWIVLGADGQEIDNGIFTVTEKEGDVPGACMRLIPIEAQILTWSTFQVDFGDRERTYYLVVVQASAASGNSSPSYADAWFYEDLTGECRTKYPDANLNAAVRAYIHEW